jgi:hypothetical protein
MTDENDLWDEKETNARSLSSDSPEKGRRIRRKGVMEEERLQFFMKVRSRRNNRG